MTCENCFKGFVLPGEPTGTFVDGVYMHAAPSPAAGPKRAVVLLSDIFGLTLVNSQIQADLLSEKLNMDVWLPDLFDGNPPIKAEQLEPLLPERAGQTISFMSYFRLALLMIPNAWGMYRTRQTVGEQRARAFLAKLRQEKSYDKVGAVGYCYGGGIAARVGSSPELVDSIVAAHPSGISDDLVKAIKVPASWACAEADFAFSVSARDAAEAVFKAREGKDDFVPYEFKDWKGCAHGFAVRPNQSIPEVKAGYEGAIEQTVNWFNKTLS